MHKNKKTPFYNNYYRILKINISILKRVQLYNINN